MYASYKRNTYTILVVYIFRHEFTVNALTDIHSLLVPLERHHDNGGVVSKHDVALLPGAPLVSLIHLNRGHQHHMISEYSETYVMA